MASNVTRLYQAVLRDRTAPISIRLRRTFSEWIVGKGFPPAEAARAKIEAEVGAARLAMERRGDCGRYTLDEPCGEGHLRTRVTYAESVPGMTGWVVVTVDRHGEGKPAVANAPGFLQAYLRTARITDGGIHVEDGPVVLDEDDVHRFVPVMTEPRRRVPIVVVSVDAQDYGERYPYRHLPMGVAMIRDQGTTALDRIVDGVIGETSRRRLPDDVQQALRVVYRVLAGRAELSEIVSAVVPPPAKTDPAREELRRRMMAMTRPLTPPVVDSVPGVPEQPQAGKPAAAEEAPSVEAESIPVAPLVDAAGLAQTVAETVIKELRGELETALRLATSSGASDSDSDRLLREIRTVGAHLSGVRDVVSGLRDVVAERRGDELLVAAEDESDRLATEIESLRDEHRLLQEEYAEAVTGARKLVERVRWLEHTLAEAGRPVYGVTGEGAVFEPANLTEVLIEARESLRHIVIGDTDSAATRLDLHHSAQCRTWAAKAWDALRALDDFAKARSRGEFSGGFYDWCANGSPGRFTIPAGMVSMRESRSVVNRSKFSGPRTFAVSPEVNPGGQVLMEAHVKLRPVGYPAPRMYFHDDSGGVTGKIWVGYLGDHLPNTRTN
ncbi:hypothetical protein ACFV0L_29090 [Streptosporangium canum]|uniref:hypothetical protein n=1 Tax=Streptosporangium canum TaxID=324952 RepID=UPI0036BFA513